MSLTPSFENPSDRIGGVAPFNRSFEVSPNDAAMLWAEGVPLPKSDPANGRLHPKRILRSSDGMWLIRRDQKKRDKERVIEDASQEFERLQELGITVISRSMLISPGGESILTLSPWISDIVPCPTDVFATEVEPKLDRYFKTSIGGPYLTDIDKQNQFSHTEWAPEPFLHDVDPFVATPHGDQTTKI
jgi:hypothetical protein